MLICLFVRHEKGGMENIIDLPHDWGFELISDVSWSGYCVVHSNKDFGVLGDFGDLGDLGFSGE